MAASSPGASVLVCSMVRHDFHTPPAVVCAPADDLRLAGRWRGGRGRALGYQVRWFRSASGDPNVALSRSWVLTASAHLGLRPAGIV
jgi:hypothetical protein